MIELKNLSRKYGDFTAVENLNLFVPRGEIFGFIGPNGAGKTTTIKMMGGIISPTSGSIHICDINMEEKPEKAKMKIGFIPDRPYLYEKLTGMEFLKFINDLYSVDGNSFYKNAEEKLAMFSLSDWAGELIESYSHGMKQRLIFAAALLHNPELIIVDEPLVGLDPEGIKMVKDLFINLAKQGVSIFMSTHTLKIAEDVCHRVGIINKGNLIAVGTIDELKQKTNTEKADLEEAFLTITR
ncbi:MAG: ABC transporter ATP-binding protein [Desulfobacterales bacterium]|jgi:ABC-2 type transport system ATP-binding protein|nr:ABC transporter ATP-binding protein [Desulfobacteraceae bacterium]MBT4363551.1 ABC transporter ATP-binding protein [Desulfobacteraceae bacterium]MBT7084790.1 ABC transporter ATP-binding protein [Desulfobacterales bacterium]MBT7698343.1 ABC transporter ATP-binding protein [Desulfobacterales bacterium]